MRLSRQLDDYQQPTRIVVKKAQPQKPEYNPALIGYCRVSTDEQSMGIQKDAMLRSGIDPDMIFEEIVSGVSTKRPVRDMATRQCRAGDTFVVWKLDRCGRSLRDLLNFISALEAKNIGFRSLTEQIDTKSPFGKLFLALLGAFAEFERDMIQQRIKAGMERRKASGARMGPTPKFTPDVRAQVEAMIGEGMSVKEAAEKLRLSPSTIRLYYNRQQLADLRDQAEPKD